jgi:hypothetical protein
MSHRRANKKLRAKIRARMQRTGETHQQALARLTRNESVIEPFVTTPSLLRQRGIALQAIAWRCEDEAQRRALENEALLYYQLGKHMQGGWTRARDALRAAAFLLQRRIPR